MSRPRGRFCEWVETDGGKRPYWVAFEDDRPFAMAELWGRWEPETTRTGLDAFGSGVEGDAGPLETFAVVTAEPIDPRDCLEPYPADESRAPGLDGGRRPRDRRGVAVDS